MLESSVSLPTLYIHTLYIYFLEQHDALHMRENRQTQRQTNRQTGQTDKQIDSSIDLSEFVNCTYSLAYHTVYISLVRTVKTLHIMYKPVFL